MGFSIVLNLNELVSSSQDNKMEIDEIDLNYQKDNLLEKYAQKLILNGASELEPEETQIWICYPKKEIEDLVEEMCRVKENQGKIQTQANVIQSSTRQWQAPKQIEKEPEVKKNRRKSEIFLFNKLNDKCAQVMSRHREEEISQILINTVDSNFINICEKMQIFNFRQMYKMEGRIFAFGDIIFKLGFLQKDVHSKIIFLEISVPYLKKYDDVKDFSYDIIKGILEIENPNEYSLYEKNEEKISEDSQINDHWDAYQYSLLLLKK